MCKTSSPQVANSGVVQGNSKNKCSEIQCGPKANEVMAGLMPEKHGGQKPAKTCQKPDNKMSDHIMEWWVTEGQSSPHCGHLLFFFGLIPSDVFPALGPCFFSALGPAMFFGHQAFGAFLFSTAFSSFYAVHSTTLETIAVHSTTLGALDNPRENRRTLDKLEYSKKLLERKYA